MHLADLRKNYAFETRLSVMPSTDKLTMLREPNYAVLFEPILIPPSSLRLVLAFRELNSSSLPHSDVGHPFFAADVQRRYAEDAKVESSFSARCGISRCRGTVGIVALIEGRRCKLLSKSFSEPFVAILRRSPECGFYGFSAMFPLLVQIHEFSSPAPT
jgi:hypothetical protein